ncbi:MAG: beta-ketoacyl synthase chain length factor [Burkholderiaceae bacterium]
MSFQVTDWVWGSAVTTLSCAGRVEGVVPDVSPLNLPAAERRRLTPLASLALSAGERLVGGRSADALQSVPLVYASRNGDGAVLLKLLTAIRDRQPVSPTQFHNSVHNAPAGYWSIGLSARAPTTALAAGDDTLEVALVEAGLQACSRKGPVLLLVAQRIFPPELQVARPATDDFVLGAWCEPASGATGWQCRVSSGLLSDSPHELPLAMSVSERGRQGLVGQRAIGRLAATLEISEA